MQEIGPHTEERIAKMDLIGLEKELQKRWVLPYNFNFKFDFNLEAKINFVYTVSDFDEVLRQIGPLPESLKQYAVNRWYNYWSNKGLNQIFSEHPDCEPVYNQYEEVEAVTIQNTLFRIKLHVFPNQFANTLRYALRHKEELIYWLYRKIKRHSIQEIPNQIFVILYQRDGEHWKLKAELSKLKEIVDNYLNEFDIHRTVRVHIIDNTVNYADTLWFIQQD